MIKLFKAKSLKSNTKTRENAGAGVRAGNKSRTKEKSKGRSMVEMLGVLAIIGVLSIGGIQGYTLAMRKYRANEILNIVQKYAMVLYSGCQQAMQQDPERNFVEDNVWYCSGPYFTDAGLGALPSGVVHIGPKNDGHSGYYPVVGDMREAGFAPGASIKSFSSGDAVVITVQFATKELCETAMGITGKPVLRNDAPGGILPTGNYGVKDSTCIRLNNEEHYDLAVVTMMN